MKLKVLKVWKPKGYFSTNITFSKIKTAEEYVNSLNDEFLLNKAQKLEHPSSKRKIKLIKFSKSKEYLLTNKGKKYLLWEKI